MKINSRKVTAFAVNTAIFIIIITVMILKYQSDIFLTNFLVNFFYFQLINTGLFLGSNSLDKLSWIKNSLPGKRKDNNNDR